jgi:hypothetical protein
MTIFLICWGASSFFFSLWAFVDAWICHEPITFKSILKILCFGVWFFPLYIYYELLEYQYKKRFRERMKKIRGGE